MTTGCFNLRSGFTGLSNSVMNLIPSSSSGLGAIITTKLSRFSTHSKPKVDKGLFDDVYDTLPRNLAAQRNHLLELYDKNPGFFTGK